MSDEKEAIRLWFTPLGKKGHILKPLSKSKGGRMESYCGQDGEYMRAAVAMDVCRYCLRGFMDYGPEQYKEER